LRRRRRLQKTRSPAFGGLAVSLPLVSLIGILQLRHATGDAERIAGLARSTFRYELPSLPWFLILPAMLRAGVGFGPSLAASCAVAMFLYFITAWVLARFGTDP
jgi:hypothetical protein